MSSIEKLELVRIMGPLEQLNPALMACLESEAFHLENASRILAGTDAGAAALSEQNPYAEPLKILLSLGLQGVQLQTEGMSEPMEDSPAALTETLTALAETFKNKQQALTHNKALLAQYENAMVHLTHLQGAEDDLGALLHCKHMICRFGRMPEENVPKLDFYESRNFVFTAYETVHAYAWGFYFTTPDQIEAVDSIMRSLFFEEFHIPDFVHGKPEEAMAELKQAVSDLKAEIAAQETELTACYDREAPKLSRIYRFLKYQNEVYKLRGQCAVVREKIFCLMGYVPLSEKETFGRCIGRIPELTIHYEQPISDDRMQPPVRLKNGAFSRPFAMFTEMYGLPSYRGFNPTTLLAITYTLVFGIMFGDLGQGLLLSWIGWFLDRKKHMPLGGIMARIGLSSAFFGILYGSVFGYEELLDPLFHNAGISFLPLHPMEHTNLFIFGAIGIGAAMIILSMIVNIVIRLKQKNLAEALFGNNGIMGLVFFGALLGIVIGILTGTKVISVPYILCLVVLPLVCMFLREPLGAWLAGKPYAFTSPVDFIASNFFECFEFLLGYATNTLSFIRVGGFVFSHAGLMSVVMLLADMTNKAASPLVIIGGNLFVMCLEGLIVGIQVLRLEFYEIFSRCYDGDGKPFTPITVSFDDCSESKPEATI